MPYSYEEERPNVFKKQYRADFLKVRDTAKRLCNEAGAVRSDKLTAGLSGSSWIMLAFVDRLVELGELTCISPKGVAAQHRVYIRN